MNKKKIIDILRKADKASVERLMAEEVKKQEIFEKAVRRANIENTEYTDSVSGVEKYERRISMTRLAGIAAAAVLVAGSIGGGLYLMKDNGEPDVPQPILHEVTTSQTGTTNTATTIKGTGTDKTTKTSVTTTVTTAATVSGDAKTTEKAVSGNSENQNENKFSVTKEELINKVENFNYLGCFDKFSSEYSYTIYAGEWRKGDVHKGWIYLDEVGLTASSEDKHYDKSGRLLDAWYFAVKDKNYIEAGDCLATIDYDNGGHIFYDTPIKTYEISHAHDTMDWGDSKVNITETAGCVITAVNVHSPNEWEITGERTENGRKIVTISGHNNNNEFGYDCNYTGEVDAATGITLSYELYLPDGSPSYIYKLESYKFDDEAVEFKTPAEIVKDIKEGGFTNKYGNENEIDTLKW
ncbi:hypothetical protein [Ruminococcus flavefaciens]|uniref:Uncharacterized protein n=1 Tax=Ruminococcus flavefaciens TaxID=1265 RepID=A0A1M7M4W8_RUMFL|nr:hypothetical protein [Ruminococcus flavefaciens]SHM85625.1 hypothetical protein SAMN04487860_11859 [Ruminococcus flavefaciens]